MNIGINRVQTEEFKKYYKSILLLDQKRYFISLQAKNIFDLSMCLLQIFTLTNCDDLK